MKLKGNYTPREAALDIAIGWLSNAHAGRTSDLSDYANTDAQTRVLKNAIARLHNRLLNTSQMDGMNIDLIEKK